MVEGEALRFAAVGPVFRRGPVQVVRMQWVNLLVQKLSQENSGSWFVAVAGACGVEELQEQGVEWLLFVLVEAL